MARKRRSLFALPLIVLACSLLGGLYGPRALGAGEADSAEAKDAKLPEDVGLFAKALALVEQNSADPLNPDKALYDGALPGMMRSLDPHSNFFDPKELALFREDQMGHYFGVGMEVTTRNGDRKSTTSELQSLRHLVCR